MGTLNEDLTAIKTIEDGLISNKVAKFAYTDLAYSCNCVAGVETYDANNEQNIPVGTASVMKVNDTVLNKGYRAQASSVTRMLLNHFLGRLSYNLNKVNDNVANLLNTLISHRGTANGLATLDANAKVPNSEIPLNIVRTVNGVGTADGAVTITYRDIGLSSTAGTPLGTASAGTMTTPARADHVHPMPTCVQCSYFGRALQEENNGQLSTTWGVVNLWNYCSDCRNYLIGRNSDGTQIQNVRVNYADCADCADCADRADKAYCIDTGVVGAWARFYWTGQNGTPTYVWGSNDGVNIYPWQPACMCVRRAGWSSITCQSWFYLIGTSSACCVYYDSGYIYNRSPHAILLFVPDSHPKVMPASSSVGVGTITLEEAGYIQIQTVYE